ncbi:MAG: hypothetical protein K6C94_10100 [Candidatus Gastranaerophilales bacterium]|nr:hypothetical protein [Candidatus Gastranaerophilales bacterium]
MNETQLMTIMGVVADPEKNVYDLSSWKNRQEMERIVRIMNISNQQKYEHKMLSIKKLATFKLVMSNN